MRRYGALLVAASLCALAVAENASPWSATGAAGATGTASSFDEHPFQRLANERRALRAHVAASKARAEACEAMWTDLRDLHAQVTHGLRAALTLADSMRSKAREQRLKLRSVQDALSEAADDADSQAARSELTQLEYERHATVGTLRGATNAIGERQQMLQAIMERMKKLKESCGTVLTTYATKTHRLELLDEEYEMRTLVKRAEEATLAEYARVAQAQAAADEE